MKIFHQRMKLCEIVAIVGNLSPSGAYRQNAIVQNFSNSGRFKTMNSMLEKKYNLKKKLKFLE